MVSRAQAVFNDQLRKHGVPHSDVLEARLIVTRTSTEPSVRLDHNHRWVGSIFVFSATAEVRGGKAHHSQRQLFVAPHNPAIELQS